MDFKQRNPNIQFWHFDTLILENKTCPFDGPNLSSIAEALHIEKNEVFLSVFADATENEDYDLAAVFYFIEAPRNCCMRHAFEEGIISCEDYWHHKNWLIEARTRSLGSTGFHVRYIHPTQMIESGKKALARESHKSPILRKYECLKSFEGTFYMTDEDREKVTAMETKYPFLNQANKKIA